MSLVLSGTFDQITKLTNVENGLFSRMLFYDNPSDTKWKNVFAKKEELPHTAFTNMGINLNHFIESVQGREIHFELTQTQEERFNELFSNKKEQLLKIYGNDLTSSLHRIAIIMYRLAMILAVVRYIGNEEEFVSKDHLVCQDIDFENAIEIMEVCLSHTISIFNKMPIKGKKKTKPKAVYFDALPDCFDRKTAMEFANLVGMNEKTAEYNLGKFIEEGILIREKHNSYKKL